MGVWSGAWRGPRPHAPRALARLGVGLVHLLRGMVEGDRMLAQSASKLKGCRHQAAFKLIGC